jgi:hypothetical protein
MLGGCLLGLIVGPVTPSTSPGGAFRYQPQEETAQELTANELVAAYRFNEARADKDYKGQMLRVNGRVREIGRDYVILTHGVPDVIEQVQCYFGFTHKDELVKLEPGQQITLRGKCRGKRIIHVVLDGCKLD